MITGWSIQNYKSILDANLRLAPLTIFCGINSSGKSSFLRSIVMLAQDAKHEGADNLVSLNGNLIKLGSFDHIYCKKAIKENHEDKDAIAIQFAIVSDGKELHGGIRLTEPALASDTGKAALELCDAENKYLENFIALLGDIPSEALSTIQDAEAYVEEKSQEFNISRATLDSLFAGITGRRLRDYGYIFAREVDTFLDYEIDNACYEKMQIANWFHLLSHYDEQKKDEFRETIVSERFKKFVSQYCAYEKEDNDSAWERCREYFASKIQYLGPLRGEPKFVYKNSSGGNNDPKGEDTPAELHEKRASYDKVAHYISPDSLDSFELNVAGEDLFVAMREWLQYIGISDGYSTKKTAGDEFELKLDIGGEQYDLPQLGTGVSQVLPILAKCLTAPVGSTIILEQPEEGLHPKMQSRLADFFIAQSLSGRQCLVETHSEYIIEQLRYRIVMAQASEPLHKKVKLYFVDKQDGISQFNEIETNEYAALSEFPEGFFDESHIIANKIMNQVFIKMKAGTADD